MHKCHVVDPAFPNVEGNDQLAAGGTAVEGHRVVGPRVGYVGILGFNQLRNTVYYFIEVSYYRRAQSRGLPARIEFGFELQREGSRIVRQVYYRSSDTKVTLAIAAQVGRAPGLKHVFAFPSGSHGQRVGDIVLAGNVALLGSHFGSSGELVEVLV